MKVIVEVSGHHCHISRRDLDLIYGKNYQLRKLRPISQPGQLTTQEMVTVKAGQGVLKNVRLVGPQRDSTHVEITLSEAYQLKIKPPIAPYSQAAGAKVGVSAEIIGPRGKIKRPAIIVAYRHLHLDPKTAKKLKLKDGQQVSLKISGVRGLIFNNILVRVNKNYLARVHLDTDEANAAGVKTGAKAEIII